MSESESLDVGYDRFADRLCLTLRGGDGVLRLWATRRLLKGLIGQFAEMLELSVEAAGEHRRAAVVFEHLEALPGSGDGGGDGDSDAGPAAGDASGGGKPAPDSEALLQQVDIRRQATTFEVALQDDAGTTHRFPLSRNQAHRLLSALYRKAAQAGWDLDPHAAWLAESGPAAAHGTAPRRGRGLEH